MESPESDIGGGAGAIQHKNTAKEINPKQSEEFNIIYYIRISSLANLHISVM